MIRALLLSRTQGDPVARTGSPRLAFPLIIAFSIILYGAVFVTVAIADNAASSRVAKVTASKNASASTQQNDSPGSKKMGTAYLGMLHQEWPCSIVRQTESGLSELRIAVLWNTFGSNLACLESYLADPRLKLIEIHLINEACPRNKNCGEYEFLANIPPATYARLVRRKNPELLQKFRDYANVVAKFLLPRLRENTRCLISPGLESNLPTTAAQILIAELKPIFPGCEMVWNPLDPEQQGTITDTILEYHGLRQSISSSILALPCLASLDGVDIDLPTRDPHRGPTIKAPSLASYLEDFRQCDTIFMWLHEFNGRNPETFTDPRIRRNFPTRTTMEELFEATKSSPQE